MVCVLDDKIKTNLRYTHPNDRIISLNVQDSQSVIDLWKILKEVMIPNDRLFISEIELHTSAELFMVCCEGLFSNVLATLNLKVAYQR
ncbi:hypothetical protein PGLA_24720 [Paenibacillus glacialis]|uniref:Uncharacterized protein n=1 Tax=Paenibacillus glacialis TaxID=494026 RepID=A0A168DDP1_9BACL|nr:hypothetical protein PGLA_24720 [Paenibacillus glacialis]